MAPESFLLYTELAPWFHLISPPEDYVDEGRAIVDFAAELIGERPGQTLLELGSGGGSLAFNYKDHFVCTLNDLSPEILAVNRSINPECEFVAGDMRTLRLGRTFDVVVIEDAIEYMLTKGDLRSALQTAYVHCRPGGIAIFAPDVIRETWRDETDSGGNDDGDRGIRFLQWMRDPDPADTRYTMDYVLLFHEGGGPVRCIHESHEQGLFSRGDYLRLLDEIGFETEIRHVSTEDDESILRDFFVARKQGG